MQRHKIAVALVCVVFFTCVWGGVASGASFTRELVGWPEPTWGAGEVFLLLGPTHGQVVGEVTQDSGLLAGEYTQFYVSRNGVLVFGDRSVLVEGPMSIYTFDPDPANPPASYDPLYGDVFHLVIPGVSFTIGPAPEPPGDVSGIYPQYFKPELISPDLDSLFNFDNAPLAQGLSWRPVITPSGGLDLLVVPEPCTLVLLLSGALGLLLSVRRGKRN